MLSRCGAAGHATDSAGLLYVYYYWPACQHSRSHIFHGQSPTCAPCDSRSPHRISQQLLRTSPSRLTARRSLSPPATPKGSASFGCVHSMQNARSRWAAPRARSRHSGHRTVVPSAISQTENCSKSKLRAGVRSICVMFEKTVAARGAVRERSSLVDQKVCIAFPRRAARRSSRPRSMRKRKRTAGPISCRMAVTSSFSLMHRLLKTITFVSDLSIHRRLKFFSTLSLVSFMRLRVTCST